MLTIALPKGRIAKDTLKVFENIFGQKFEFEDRKLILETDDFRFLLVRNQDVPTYVFHQSADLGVVGLDVLEEKGLDLIRLLNLQGGYCKVAIGMKKWLGIDWNPLLNSSNAMLMVVLASAWKNISYNFVFFLAGLQAVPHSLIEAAAMDGASPFRRFWAITFPLLSPTMFFVTVMTIIFSFFESFGVIHAVTQGGPGGSTNILVYKVYQDGFIGLNLGSSSAQSVVLMGLIIVITVLQFKYVERKVQYTG
jgi:ATP phosphoribosyltransferase